MLEELKILRDHISNHRIREVCERLIVLSEINNEIRNKAIIQKANFFKLRDEITKGIIRKEDEEVQTNIILSSLLVLIDEVENLYLIEHSRNVKSPPSNTGKEIRIGRVEMLIKNQNKTRRIYLTLAVLAFLAGVSLVVYILVFMHKFSLQVPISLATTIFSIIGGSLPYREVIKANESIGALLLMRNELESSSISSPKEYAKTISKIDEILWKKIESQILPQ